MNKNLTIQTYFPKVLHDSIEAFRVYRFKDETDVFLVPKGVFEIVFQSQHTFQHKTNYSSGWSLRPRNFVGGLHNQSYYVNSGRRENYCIVVEFKPNTAKLFIPEKLNYFQNAVVDINEIWGKSAQNLAFKIDKEKEDNKKVELIEDFLLGHKLNTKKSSIDRSLKTAFDNNGFVEVGKLCEESYLSQAQFRKRFKEEVGISPSQYNKILRVNLSLANLLTYKESLTDLTYKLGYYDQSHFIKDFKSIMGISPKQYKHLIA